MNSRSNTPPSSAPRTLFLALAADENYLDGLVGTLAGVARFAHDTSIRAAVLDCGIHDASWAAFQETLRASFPQLALQRLEVSDEQLRIFNPANAPTRLSNAAYARMLLPRLLPDVDRVLYLDSDLLVDTDLRPLFATPLEGALVAAVQDAHVPLLCQNVARESLTDAESASPAFNSGVLLMDLSAMRQVNLIEQVLSLPAPAHIKFQDQAVLNRVLHGRWKALPPRWNRQRFVTENFSIYRDRPDSVWHFIGKMKPWHFDPAFMRGLVADFHRNVTSSGWTPRLRGKWRPLSPAWRDSIKATHAFTLRRVAAFLRP